MPTLVLLIGSLLAVAFCEWAQPRQRRTSPAFGRRLSNLGIWGANLVLGIYLLPSVVGWAPPRGIPGISLVPWLWAKIALSIFAGFLLLDLLHYWVHRIEHAVPVLWRLHAMHHTDPEVDVTTSVRHHPAEYFVAGLVYWAAAVVVPIPPGVVLVHALAVFGTAAVQHGNISLPDWCERMLQPLLLTPDLHRVHHSVKRVEADANYGAVLSFWDRLFGTLTRLSPAEHQRLVFGVAGVPRADGLQPVAMLSTPWQLGRNRAKPLPRNPRQRSRRQPKKAPSRPQRV